MIRRLFVHNFRCLQNFELPIGNTPSALLIGNNGSGKSTVGAAFLLLQRLARGSNRVKELVSLGDPFRGNSDAPIRFEIEAEIDQNTYSYAIAFELPEGFKEYRVMSEQLKVDGQSIYSRKLANVSLSRTKAGDAGFTIDWHLVALPIIQQQSTRDPIFIFKTWLSRMLILRPIPTLMSGESKQETLEPVETAVDFGAWFAGLIAFSPSSYSVIDRYLKDVMPDIKDIRNPLVGTDARSLEIQFATSTGSIVLPFADLSDGEKCFMICALVLATKAAFNSTFCFWDEPDTYLALSEVGHFLMSLRKAFQSGGQFITTSHNPEAIRRFSGENTFVLYRKSHLEPTSVRILSDMHVEGDLIGALIRGEVEP